MYSLVMTHSGPGLWVLSQALLLIYFKMDNGSNVCGLEFNYNNEEFIKERVEESGEKKKEVEEEGEQKKKEEEDSKSLIDADQSDIEVHFNDQLLRKLILGKFEVQSEEGRSVYWAVCWVYNKKTSTLTINSM